MQHRHDIKIQELDHALEDKENCIKELLHQLRQVKGTSSLQTMPHPPGIARRTASIGVQTLANAPDEPAILPAHGNYSFQEDASPATMTSLSSEEAVIHSISGA